MEAKEVRELMEAYASVYEGKKSDCVDKEDKGAHNCAKKVCHEQFGKGTCIFGQHSVPDENGFVSHYDVIFEHGIEKNVPVSEMEVLISESHMKEGHHYEGEQLEDLFDLIKGHLISEGYAETEEAAIAIMSSMSETWKQSIVENLGTMLRNPEATIRRALQPVVTALSPKPTTTAKPTPRNTRLVDVSTPEKAAKNLPGSRVYQQQNR